MQNKNIKQYLQKRIEHANKRVKHIEESHGNNPGETHTYFAGKSLGYYKGLLEAYQNCLDEINENNKTE